MKAKRRKNEGTTGFRYWQSFKNSLAGLKYAIVYEQNFIVITIALVLVSAVAYFVKISAIEWVILFFLFGLITSLELLNSAIEATIDLFTLEYHELAKIAKDCASGATLISVITSVVIGLIIFIPKIF